MGDLEVRTLMTNVDSVNELILSFFVPLTCLLIEILYVTSEQINYDDDDDERCTIKSQNHT